MKRGLAAGAVAFRLFCHNDEKVSFSNDPPRRGGRGPDLPETKPVSPSNERQGGGRTYLKQKKKSYPRRATKALRLAATGYQSHDRIVDFRLFHSRMIRTAGRGPDLSETKPVSLSNHPPRRGGRGPGSRANGSFPKGARRLSEKPPGAHPPPHQPSPGGSASATPPQGGSDCPGSAGVPPASCPFGRR